ncbi:hypothetical protein GMORB2_4443 [Geosmithia morbida]|uniref:Uncharacterized protein n=1 Tax=Geosmithia morbida TaxID=1094350 RepID=A0A9P5CYU7_9HYPO|nr:uncharacterized protein GMORB2_4443 [Geosmithia morbida]KAF4119777.1 hypothetical protein GMORB2_4443 [Geosmithia morbida]
MASPTLYTALPAASSIPSRKLTVNAQSSSSSNDQVSSEDAPPSPNQPLLFPRRPIFVSYRSPRRSYIYGPESTSPMYALRAPRPIASHHHHTLYSGPTEASAPLATVGRVGEHRRPLVRVYRPSSAHPGGTSVAMTSGRRGRRFRVSLDRDDGTVEQFEWRNSRGPEACSLCGGRGQQSLVAGWKLARMAEPATPRSGTARRPVGYTSDGREVVAAGALVYGDRNPRFAFMGSGATGRFGETFEIVTLMGFLELYYNAISASI